MEKAEARKVTKRGQGEGNYTKLPDGRVRWRTTVTTPAGERIATSGTASNMTEARRAVRETRQAGENQTLTRKKDLITVQQLIENYIDARIRSEKIKSRTVDDYRYTLGKYIQPHIGELKAQKVTGDDLKRFFDDLELERIDAGKIKGTGDRTRAKIHLLLQAAFRWGVQQGTVHKDPTIIGRPKRTNSKEDVEKISALDAEQADRLFNYTSVHQDYWIFAFMLRTGVRPGEALALCEQDVAIDPSGRMRITIARTRSLSQGKVYEDTPKTKKSRRIIPVSDEAARVVFECLQRIEEDKQCTQDYKGKPYELNDYLFVSRSGAPYRLDNLGTKLRKACKAAEVPIITPHKLRHTFISLQAADGTQMEPLSRYVGHATSDMTRNRYRYSYDHELDEIAEKKKRE